MFLNCIKVTTGTVCVINVSASVIIVSVSVIRFSHIPKNLLPNSFKLFFVTFILSSNSFIFFSNSFNCSSRLTTPKIIAPPFVAFGFLANNKAFDSSKTFIAASICFTESINIIDPMPPAFAGSALISKILLSRILICASISAILSVISASSVSAPVSTSSSVSAPIVSGSELESDDGLSSIYFLTVSYLFINSKILFLINSPLLYLSSFSSKNLNSFIITGKFIFIFFIMS